MITVEKGTLEDVAAGAEAGRKFYETTAYTDIPYDVPTVKRLLAKMIEEGTLVVLKADGVIVGGAGGLTGPIFFNDDSKVGFELFWWIEPAYRGQGLKLLRALERAAQEVGCTHWVMMALEDQTVEQVDVLYRRRDYRRIERGYLKRF